MTEIVVGQAMRLHKLPYLLVPAIIAAMGAANGRVYLRVKHAVEVYGLFGAGTR